MNQTCTPLVALLTPRGRGAVASIRLVGDCRLIDERGMFRAVNGKPVAAQPVDRIVFGHWGHDPVEDVVVCRRTAHDLEIHCHGGDAAAQRILDELNGAGCEVHSALDLATAVHGVFAAECTRALSRAPTLRTANLLLEQASGLLEAVFTGLRGAAWDDRPDIQRRLDDLLSWSRFGLHLSQSWSVVVTGRPNVGKSSLINALLGYRRAIVFDEPGTTRDVLTAETAFQGWPVQLADTAGLRDAVEELESAGIAKARQQLAAADCRLVLIDVSLPPTADDRLLLAEWPEELVVAHKADLPDAWGPALAAGAVRVSSLTGAGLAALADAIVERIVPELPPPGTAVPFTARQAALLERARLAVQAGDQPAFRAAIEALQPPGGIPSHLW